jgi:phosphoglycolate phosphatase
MPDCPVISEATDVYGRAWARALGRAFSREFEREIDRLFLDASLEHLQPIGAPHAVLSALRQGDYRLGIMTNDAEPIPGRRCSGSASPGWWNSSPAMTRVSGRNLTPRRSWRLPSAVGVASTEIAVVGDSPHDLIAARAGGGRRDRRPFRAERRGCARAACRRAHSVGHDTCRVALQ